ncbi:MAG: leucine-rich repeat domain-containing protein [Oscillospiraceae bacterium]|nr:leucine-rich repeat domain-containing protein [Oscillospiraceae bacterium]
MSSDTEKKSPEQPVLPAQPEPPAQLAGESVTPRMVLPEDDSEPDFILDIPPVRIPAEPPSPPKAGQNVEEPEPEETAPEPSAELEEEPDEEAPAPLKKGFFAMLSEYRFRFFGLFSRSKNDRSGPENPPKPQKPPKAKKAKKEKKAAPPPPQAAAAGDGIVDPTQEGAGVTAGKKSKPKPTALPRADKTDKPQETEASGKPAKKKPSAKKPKAEKAATKASDGGKKLSKKLIIIIVAGVLAAGAIVFAILFFLNREPPDPILEAQALMEAGEYAAAREIYGGLLEDGERAAEAYLGVGESLIAEGDVEGAAERLRAGFEATGDPRLEARMLEIMPEDEAPPPPVDPTPIVWQDKALERMVRLALGKPDGDITEGDLKEVTTLKILGTEHSTTLADGLNSINTLEGYTLEGTHYTERGEIESLADLAHFKSLRRLTVGYNRVSSLKGLEELDGLELLALYANEIEDLTPLAGLVNLRNLYLYGNAVGDLSPLRGLTGLRGLSVQHNAITDLSPLSGMTAMRELYLSGNEITDISPLSGMAELIFLNAQNNQIEDISALEDLANLTDINFQGNPVIDLSPAAHVQNTQSSFS